MKDVLQVIQYVVPPVIVFLTSWFILKEFFNREKSRQMAGLKDEKIRISIPLRLQAYERLVLFLERITAGNLVMRVYKPGVSAKQFQQQLITSVRDEFDHNLSQQLYISSEAWERIRMAKEEIIQKINASAAKLQENATGTELTRVLLETSIEKSATRSAMDYLKAEARKLF